MLDGLEKNFMSLAECARNLENSDISDEFLGVRLQKEIKLRNNQSCPNSVARKVAKASARGEGQRPKAAP